MPDDDLLDDLLSMDMDTELAEYTLDEIQLLERNIAQALRNETRFINTSLAQYTALGAFALDWPKIARADNVDRMIRQAAYESFRKNMHRFVEAHIRKLDNGLSVPRLSKRTVSWAHEWSEELGRIMKLNSHTALEKLLAENLRDGKGVAHFARQLMDEGIRDTYVRAKRVAQTEMLRAHAVAQQEAIIQNPAVDNKEWVHTGAHKNKPRENHMDIDGQIVPKDQPFKLKGADGGDHAPMYPRDTDLPPCESINCKCTHRGIPNDDVLGLSLEERKKLQAQAIAEDDGKWEKELDRNNMMRDREEYLRNNPQ